MAVVNSGSLLVHAYEFLFFGNEVGPGGMPTAGPFSF